MPSARFAAELRDAGGNRVPIFADIELAATGGAYALTITDEGGPNVSRGNASEAAHIGGDRWLLANGESHNAIVEIVADPVTRAPQIGRRAGPKSHSWAAAAKGGVLLVRQSLDGAIRRVAPDFSGSTLLDPEPPPKQGVLTRRGHSIATDGRWIVAPGEHNTLPGRVTLIDALTNEVVHRLDVADVWPERTTYSTRFDAADPRTVYCGVAGRGVYRFTIEESTKALVYRGRLIDGSAGSNFSVYRRVLWISKGSAIRVWDWTIDDAPALVTEFLGAPHGKFPMTFGASNISPNGRFLAITQRHVTTTGGEVQDAPRGVAVFDVTSWPFRAALATWSDGVRFHDPWFATWNAAGDELLASYFRIGVGVLKWDATDRTLSTAGRVPTAGEGADGIIRRNDAQRVAMTFAKETAFVSIEDAPGHWRVTDFLAQVQGIEQGRFIVWRDEPLQLFTPRTRRAWTAPTVTNPKVQFAHAFSTPKQQWGARLIERGAERFLLLAGEAGLALLRDLGALDISTGLSVQWLSLTPPPIIRDLSDWLLKPSVLIDVEVIGDTAWCMYGWVRTPPGKSKSRHVAGIIGYDLRGRYEPPWPGYDPTAPENSPLPIVAQHDWIPGTPNGDGWWEHGNMSNLAQYAGRLYAGAGRGGIRECDGVTGALIAAYFERQITATSLAIRADGVAAWSHYWQPDPPDPRPFTQGIHFGDARARGGLVRVAEWPGGGGTESWTVREQDGRFIATTLYDSRSLRVDPT